MLLPYPVALGYKYKAKLTPGPAKKGKAAQAATHLFLAQAKAGGTARELDFVKSLVEADVVNAAHGGSKVAAPAGTATGSGKK